MDKFQKQSTPASAAPNPGEMTVEQVKAMTPEQVNKMTPEQFAQWARTRAQLTADAINKAVMEDNLPLTS